MPATPPSGRWPPRIGGASTQPSRTGAPAGAPVPAGAQTRPEGRPAMTTNGSAGRPAWAALRAIHQPPQWKASGSATGTSPRLRDASHQPTGSNGSRPAVHGTSSTGSSRIPARHAARERAATEVPGTSGNEHSRPDPLVRADDRALGVLDRVRQRYERRLGRRHEPVDAGRTEGRAGSVQPQCAEELAPEIAVVAGDVPSLVQPGRPYPYDRPGSTAPRAESPLRAGSARAFL